MYMDFDFDLDKDFVFTSDKGILTGGGFKIKSQLLNDTINDTLSNNKNNKIQTGGGSSFDLLKDLAVPAGLFYTQKKVQKNHTIKYDNRDETINNDIYDKLLGLLEPQQKINHVKNTRKNKKKKQRKTRKNL